MAWCPHILSRSQRRAVFVDEQDPHLVAGLLGQAVAAQHTGLEHKVAATVVKKPVCATTAVRAWPAGVWCQGCNTGRDGLGDHSGLCRLRLHLPRLRLSQGPAQSVHLSLEGAIALPGQPELEVHARVGLPQQHLQQQLLGGGPGSLQSLLRTRTAGVNHAGARGLIGARQAEHTITVEHVVPVAGHQRQVVVAALCYADVPGALGDQSHVPVAGEGT